MGTPQQLRSDYWRLAAASAHVLKVYNECQDALISDPDLHQAVMDLHTALFSEPGKPWDHQPKA